MRNLVAGISLIFFVLSGVVTFKALNIPVTPPKMQIDQDVTKMNSHTSIAENPPDGNLNGQASEQPVVQDLQSVHAGTLVQGPDNNSAVGTNDKISGTINKARVLAVIGAGAFNSGQIVIDDALMSTIKKVVPDILSSPGYKVYIEGHTDDIPIKASSDKRYIDNMELSFLRAKAVASILVENGISLERISVTGYGESRPIASNESDEGRIINRRVEIKLVPEDKES
ncbi:MAG: OmpA family protein [Nitrospiraceae bacterium]|nr:MAG: OmpA family protein [Nitrospiraceae bacterium]